jgi:hypothetical protein
VLSRKQARWAKILSSYDVVIEDLEGKKTLADQPSTKPEYEIGYKRPTARLLKTLVTTTASLFDDVSVSNGSWLRGFGLGWNRPEGPCPGQELPSNPTRSVLAGLLPGPDINPRFLAGLNPDRGSIFAVPATFASIKYLSSDRMTI